MKHDVTSGINMMQT